MEIFRKFFFKDPAKPLFWLALGFIVKGILPFLWLLHSHPHNDIPGFWGGTGGDTFSYLAPIDNWLKNGIYSPDFRMPGYGAVYLIFRWFSSLAVACNLLLVLQFLLVSVSVYFIGLTARNIFKSDSVFYASFYLYLISSFPNLYDGCIQTESLCTSFLIFSVYFLTSYFNSKKLTYLLLSAVLITWAVFMRPAFALLIPVFAIFIVLQNRSKIGKNIKFGMLFLVPFICVDGLWTLRNYKLHKKMIPLTTIGNYPNIESTYLQPMFNFVQCWGGAYSFGDKEPDLSWFDYTYSGRIKPLYYDSLPDNIYTSAYTKDSLLHLKKLILALQNPLIDSSAFKSDQRELITKFTKYKESFRREKSITYYIQTPLKLTDIFLYGAYTKKYLDRGQTLKKLNLPLKILSNGIYLTVLLLGLSGMCILLFKGLKRNIVYLLILSIPMYTIIIHAVILRIPDGRFLMPVWAFMVICCSYQIEQIYVRFLKKP